MKSAFETTISGERTRTAGAFGGERWTATQHAIENASLRAAHAMRLVVVLLAEGVVTQTAAEPAAAARSQVFASARIMFAAEIRLRRLLDRIITVIIITIIIIIIAVVSALIVTLVVVLVFNLIVVVSSRVSYRRPFRCFFFFFFSYLWVLVEVAVDVL